MSTTYPHTLSVSAGTAAADTSRVSLLASVLGFARSIAAAFTEHQHRRAQRVVLPYLALQPDKTLTDLGYSPELIKELRYAYRNRA